jgi:putative tryptophan/tyrosine transport system substrate-binding protein
VNIFTGELAAKRLGLLQELLPATSLIAHLVNPNFPPTESNAREVEMAARVIGRKVLLLKASSENDIDAAFATMSQMRVAALLVGADPFFFSRRAQIVALAARQGIPAIYEQREFAGGLMSYGTSLTDAYRQEGIYAGRILKGEKPSELPVIQLSKFELVINLKTAKELGITLPSGLLAIADEAIEQTFLCRSALCRLLALNGRPRHG